MNKNSFGKNLLVSILALVVGFLASFAVFNIYFTNDLNFYLVGDSTTNIGLGSTYNEQGVVCNFRGKDYSNDVVISYYNNLNQTVDSINTNTPTSYIVKYNVDNGKITCTIQRIVNIVAMDDLEINFLTLGNGNNGDCIYIKAGETDILVDAGSKRNSATAIKEYLTDSDSTLHSYVEDNKLEYVIATHAHEDHIAAFIGENSKKNGIFYEFEIDTLIDFPMTNSKSGIYNDYKNKVDELEKNGMKHYTALECYNDEDMRVIEVAAGIEIEILYNYYYENEARKENNYSVCFMLRRGEQQFLFTGDLEHEENAESYLVDNNNLGEVYLYKLGHHGSKTSSSMKLLNEIKPKVAIVTCVAFCDEYDTSSTNNLFPTEYAINNLVTVGTVEHLYVTSMATFNSSGIEVGYEDANGDIVVRCSGSETIIECSNDNRDFFEFDIFDDYRDWVKN